MKTTRHFEIRLLERPYIRREWCVRIAEEPLERVVQDDGRVVCWGYVLELGKYLRVVLLDDGETFETVHIDRNYARKRR